MGQLLLIPDPRPLDRRLGKKFFRKAPRRPGVYLMKDKEDRVVYVGKAKDLKQRLGNYRIANPDRMPRRHLRMVREVERIEFQFCQSEAAALKHEKLLIRSLRPKFNRAGVWPGKPKFIVWRVTGEAIQLSVMETPATNWQRFGPLGGGATYLHRAMARLLWLAVNLEKGAADLPTGWAKNEFMETTSINCGANLEEVTAAFESFFWDSSESFVGWLRQRFAQRATRFEQAAIQNELEFLSEFEVKHLSHEGNRKQLALL